MWAVLHLTHSFETIRIPYTFNGIDHTYIVDFDDAEGKMLYEIKPKEHTTDKKVIAKELAAKDWCSLNGYTFQIITQDYLISREIELMESSLSTEIKLKVTQLCKK